MSEIPPPKALLKTYGVFVEPCSIPFSHIGAGAGHAPPKDAAAWKLDVEPEKADITFPTPEVPATPATKASAKTPVRPLAVAAG